LTDMRVGVVKAALQMTPDQEKYWPADEEAIRARAKNRQARLERIAELHENGAVETLRERNPVEMMQRRADMLVQRDGLVVRKRTNKHVARELDNTERTIKAHRQVITEKMSVQSLAQLVTIAERLGVLQGSGPGDQN
jgi:FixJ family two-component response regulator